MTVGFLLRRIDCNDGVASHLETLMRGLAASGVKIVLITGPVHRRDVASARYESLAAFALDWVKLDLPVGKRPVTWIAIRQLSRAIRQHQIVLLHLHGLATLHLARLAMGVKRIPVVATAHPSGTSTRGPRGVVKRMIQTMKSILRPLYFPDVAIAISSDLRDWFVDDVCMDPAQVQTIFHGVDANHFRQPTAEERSEARKYFGISNNDVIVTLLGRYEPVKRHDLLIESFGSIASRCPDMRLLLVGAGGFEQSIRKMVDNSQLRDRIWLSGAILDARTAFWASDILVLPSDREGFGLAVAEAMLCGIVPVRTATAGAYDQIVEGENGFIVPIGGTRELADTLKTLYEKPVLREKLSEAAARSAKEKFDATLMAERTLGVYRALIKDIREEPVTMLTEAVSAEYAKRMATTPGALSATQAMKK